MTNLSLARLTRLALVLSFAAVGCAAPAEEPEEMSSTESHITGNPESPDRITIVRSWTPGFHLTTVRTAPMGMKPEAAFYTRTSGSRALFLCDKGRHRNFPSNDPNCEGYGIIDFIGYVDQNEEGTRVPLYRCLIPSITDHFISTDPNCEGQRMEGQLGWVEWAPVPAMIPLPDYNSNNSGGA